MTTSYAPYYYWNNHVSRPESANGKLHVLFHVCNAYQKGIFHVTWLILPYLEHHAYLHNIVYSYWARRCRSRWDTTNAAAESVHSGESPLGWDVDSFSLLMMNNADARRQTPGLATPMSAVHLYWCLGVGSDVICQASSVGLDHGYVKILQPNRIGLLLANQWTSRPTNCSKLWRYY
jgi:hypothetical protein